MVNLITYLIAVCFVLYLDIKISKVKSDRVYNSIKKNLNVYKILGYSLVFSFLIIFLSHLLTYFGFIKDIIKNDFNFMLIIFNLSTIILTPIIEEYFFRYLPIKVFKNKDYHLGIMLISSILFTYIHKVNGIEYLIVFISSLMLSFLYLKNKNILYSIIPHALYNFLVIFTSCLISKINLFVLIIDLIFVLIGILIIKKEHIT